MDLKITRGGFFLNLHGARRPVQKGAVVTVADEIGARLIEQGRAIPVDVSAPAEGGEPVVTANYDEFSVEDLTTLAEQRGLEVAGSGKDGRVVKADLVAALTASDEQG